MTSTKLFFLAQTVLLPIVLCLVRFKDIKRLYLPLFIYLVAKELTEVISYSVIHFYKASNAVPYNIMFLAEAVLITWQFSKLGVLNKNRKVYYAIQAFWVLLWLLDMTVFGSLFTFNIVFRVNSCFILVLIALPIISKSAITARYKIYRNTAFLFSLIFACWFAYNILYEFSYKIAHISEVYKRIGLRITSVIGFAESFMYIILSWAIYCIPVRRNFKSS